MRQGLRAAWRLEDVYRPKFAAALFANMMAPSDDLPEGVFAAIFAEWYTLRFQGDGTRNLVRRVVDDGFFEPGRERDLADRIGDTVRWRVLDVLRPGANGTWIVRDAVTGETYLFYSVMFETGRDLRGDPRRRLRRRRRRHRDPSRPYGRQRARRRRRSRRADRQPGGALHASPIGRAGRRPLRLLACAAGGTEPPVRGVLSTSGRPPRSLCAALLGAAYRAPRRANAKAVESPP